MMRNVTSREVVDKYIHQSEIRRAQNKCVTKISEVVNREGEVVREGRESGTLGS